MKKTIFIFLIIFLPFTSFSQRFSGGLLLGVNGNQIDGDDSSGYNKAGLLVGGFVSTGFSEKTSLIIELYYTGKGSMKKTEQSGAQPIFKTNLHYIEFPILFSLKAIPKLTFSVGVAPSYLISAKLFGNGNEISENTYTMNDFDIGITGQIDFNFSKKIIFNLRYNHSIASIRKNYGWYNNNLSLLIKYKIN